jgi:hypothetical protein
MQDLACVVSQQQLRCYMRPVSYPNTMPTPVSRVRFAPSPLSTHLMEVSLLLLQVSCGLGACCAVPQFSQRQLVGPVVCWSVGGPDTGTPQRLPDMKPKVAL